MIGDCKLQIIENQTVNTIKELTNEIRLLNKQLDILVETTHVCIPEYFDLFFCEKNKDCNCEKCNREYLRKYAEGTLPSRMLKVIHIE